jgi:hypothetical protein
MRSIFTTGMRPFLGCLTKNCTKVSQNNTFKWRKPYTICMKDIVEREKERERTFLGYIHFIIKKQQKGEKLQINAFIN